MTMGPFLVDSQLPDDGITKVNPMLIREVTDADHDVGQLLGSVRHAFQSRLVAHRISLPIPLDKFRDLSVDEGRKDQWIARLGFSPALRLRPQADATAQQIEEPSDPSFVSGAERTIEFRIVNHAFTAFFALGFFSSLPTTTANAWRAASLPGSTDSPIENATLASA